MQDDFLWAVGLPVAATAQSYVKAADLVDKNWILQSNPSNPKKQAAIEGDAGTQIPKPENDEGFDILAGVNDEGQEVGNILAGTHA